ncbi:adenosylmethionine decarboxylase [Coprinopsis cinerea okayama7|uniref:adenosylmethionine decarboxylase n=1 Tax=Coprinopsis cinerea (strain Okayama-7 / 130 / ATCC MYA-4618 / FGSC 9003) TaxID=240176 RepID=A8N6N8_COPC7|nr:adenosylmethionine decarboxylase [Coprinopsis cinerea okayama7\|eukprot:XP_001830494.1 adenosylmethionine decarboxylase [Coprinopsis cinerea okayama7\
MPEPFEGPEKLLELWFEPSETEIQGGLRGVPRESWEEMLDIVRCKVLSVVNGEDHDAYLLSESSLFVASHKLILKTCGTTLNLLGLPRIIEIAAQQAGLPIVHRCFYSRKSFMFPDRQQGPHRDWKEEVEFLDKIFSNGAAYTVGKMNGDHWLLYLTDPDELLSPSPISEKPSQSLNGDSPNSPVHLDYTIEILMSGLSPTAREHFFLPEDVESEDPQLASAHGLKLSEKIGISDIFPSHLTTLDAYSFTPCGYSSNALIKWGEDSLNSEDHPLARQSGEGYYTIHVTPEAGWSYASFECNVPLSVGQSTESKIIPDLQSLIKRVVSIFQPNRLTLTLFISSADSGDSVELAQRDFKRALDDLPESAFGYPLKGPPRRYRRTDKINYEFGGYDLAFASFELK